MKYAKTYKELINYRGGHLRSLLRSIILNIKSSLLSSQVDKNFKGIQFLYFHYLFDDELSNAEKIIEWINDNFNVISYSEAVDRLKNNDIDDYYVCFSSDDGFKNNLQAAKVFKKHNISCCFFVNPATIMSNNKEFQKVVCNQRLGTPLMEFLTLEDLHQLINDGHEIGDHSYEHIELNTLSKEEFINDLSKSHSWFKEHLGEVKHYAYPRGLKQFFTKEYLDIVYSNNYSSCASAIRGCHVANQKMEPDKSFIIRRDVLVFKEPLSYVKYFMRKAQKEAREEHTFW